MQIEFRTRPLIMLATVAAATALTIPSAAAADATLTITMKQGAKADSMPIEAWEFGGHLLKTGQVDNRDEYRPVLNEVKVTKALDPNTPKLFELFVTRAAAPSASLAVTRTFGRTAKTYMKYCFGDVSISSIDDRSAGSRDPVETIGFNYGWVTLSYTPLTSSGSSLTPFRFGWNAITMGALSGSVTSGC